MEKNEKSERKKNKQIQLCKAKFCLANTHRNNSIVRNTSFEREVSTW